MLTGSLIHPLILGALAAAGHGSRVLISDGNFPHRTARGPNAAVVYLNLSPGCVRAIDVLSALTPLLPIEAASVMARQTSGPYAMDDEPPIWQKFRDTLNGSACGGRVDEIERNAFYQAARGEDVCLTIATGEQEIYANLLLTIGVVQTWQSPRERGKSTAALS